MSGACATCAKHDTCFYGSERVVDCVRHEPKLETNYETLFGTPERAAETLKRMDVDVFNWCVDDNGNHKNCGACPYEYDYYGCYLPDGFSLLEWLKGGRE